MKKFILTSAAALMLAVSPIAVNAQVTEATSSASKDNAKVSANTSDNNNDALWAGALVISVVAAGAAVAMKKA